MPVTSEQPISVTPDFKQPVDLLTDYSISSYVELSRSIKRTLEMVGLTVDEYDVQKYIPGNKSGCVIWNTIAPRFAPDPTAYNIAIPLHEWSRYPKGWVAKLNRFNEIWAMSDHMNSLLVQSGVTIPIYDLPPALDLDMPPVKTDWTAGTPFQFLSCGEAHFRKGFHLLMDGFMSAFPQPGEATLTIKTSQGCTWQSPREDIVINASWLDRDELLGLYANHDAYVSASLAEGIGLPIAEAILARTPVVTNYWGGHVSLLTRKAFWEIEHQEVLQLYCSHPDYFAPGQKCAYCSPDNIATALKDVASSTSDERRQRTQTALDFLSGSYGTMAVKQAFERRFGIKS